MSRVESVWYGKKKQSRSSKNQSNRNLSSSWCACTVLDNDSFLSSVMSIRPFYSVVYPWGVLQRTPDAGH